MGAPKNNNLTQRDLELAGMVWKCFKTEPQVDFQKLAQLAGFKNPATASACWGPVKKKLTGHIGSAKGGAASAPSTPTSARGKRKAFSAKPYSHDAGDDDEFPSTPTPASKRAKKAVSSVRGKKSPLVYVKAGNDDNDGGVEGLKLKKEIKDEDLDGNDDQVEQLAEVAFFDSLDPDEPYA